MACMYIIMRAQLLATATDREHSASTADSNHPDAPCIECATPDKHSARERSPNPRSAIASLRHNLSRHSRHSGRGSMSHVFRRSVDASSLRGAYDPENIIRNSQDTRKTTPPPAKDGDKSRDPATLVPLPSSPIDIPPPPHILRVDLGPPAMLSPFQLTHSDLAEIKVLQDPSNITTGIPQSCPLNWPDIDMPFRLQPEAVPEAAANSELPEVGSQWAPANLHRVIFPPVSVGEQDEILGCCTSDLTPSNPPRSEESHVALIYEHPGHGPATHEVDCDNPFQDPFSSPKVSRHSAAASNRMDITTGRQSLNHIQVTTCCVSKPSSPVASAEKPQMQTDAVCRREALPDDAIDVLQLPSPVVALRTSLSQRTGIREQTDHVTSKDNPRASDEAPVDTEISRAQKKYRDSLAGLEEGLELEKLDSKITRHVEQNTFVGAPGIPAPAFCRSETVVPTAHSSPLDENFDAVQIPTRVTRTDHIQEFKENRKYSLFLSEDTKHEIVHQHGPPSPERSVQIPLRPKPAKQASFESTLFKPILDRVAAKQLGVFRPGSDPSSRQKYFPHSAISTNSPFRYPRQSSLDLDDTESDDSESCENLRLFERTVEQPSPLNIRKQTKTTPVHTTSPPQTPASTSTLQAPGSSPIRTPSMGDRRLFDLQRAERDARYNAILSGESPSTVLKSNLDIQLAEFDNAGPGSKGSSPTRSSGGRGRERRMSLTYLQRLMGQDTDHAPIPRSACLAFKTLSRD